MYVRYSREMHARVLQTAVRAKRAREEANRRREEKRLR